MQAVVRFQFCEISVRNRDILPQIWTGDSKLKCRTCSILKQSPFTQAPLLRSKRVPRGLPRCRGQTSWSQWQPKNETFFLFRWNMIDSITKIKETLMVKMGPLTKKLLFNRAFLYSNMEMMYLVRPVFIQDWALSIPVLCSCVTCLSANVSFCESYTCVHAVRARVINRHIAISH